MTYPVIPIAARVGVVKSFKNEPYVLEFSKGQVKEYIAKNVRHIANSNINFNAFITNITEIRTFLDSLQGYKPFKFVQQTEQLYICIGYTIDYEDPEKGTIQMTLIKYTNESV